MASTIITKNSSTASAVPTAGQLVQGELAVNVTDKKIFTRDSGGNIVVLAQPAVAAEVTLTNTATLTNKTLTAPVITGAVLNDGYTEEVYNLTGTEINPANGSIQYKTLSGNTTFTEALSDGQSVTLMLNPSTFTTTWPTMTWIGSVASTAPTLVASVYNCITIFQFGGTVYGKYEGRV